MKKKIKCLKCGRERPQGQYWKTYCYHGCRQWYNKYCYEKRKELNKSKRKCIFCKSKQSIHIHHIDKNINNNNKNNLLIVCARCHILLHKRIYKYYEPRKKGKK